MLIKIQDLCNKYKLSITGILHIGAHECEEWGAYQAVGLTKNKIIWIDALQEKVNKMRRFGHNIYQLVAHDKDGEKIEFHITNNYQSSSILPLEEHLREHPHIYVIEKRPLTTTRIDTFYNSNDIAPDFANFANLDIQGNELSALLGMGSVLNHMNYIYIEVNIKHLYKDGCLLNELDTFLHSNGFERVEISMTKHGWGDAFYIRM
jgi:FkbM family methyltransferase